MKAIVVTDQAAETVVLVLHGGGPVGARLALLLSLPV